MAVLQITLSWVASRDHRLMVRVNHYLAASPMAAAVDAGRDPQRRWRTMVRAGHRRGALRRTGTISRAAGSHSGGRRGHRTISQLKRVFRRKRPCELEPHCWADLLPPDQFSFPSGHTITAFAVTAALAGFYPEMLPGLLFCAISIAASRVVLGMHFLSDVIAGAVLGLDPGARWPACWSLNSRRISPALLR